MSKIDTQLLTGSGVAEGSQSIAARPHQGSYPCGSARTASIVKRLREARPGKDFPISMRVQWEEPIAARSGRWSIAMRRWPRVLTLATGGPPQLRTFAYVRVSTTGQTTENQIQEIETARFKVDPRRVVSETVSGSSASRGHQTPKRCRITALSLPAKQ
jgi:hypothetical protein